jgi:hypothetical protein
MNSSGIPDRMPAPPDEVEQATSQEVVNELTSKDAARRYLLRMLPSMIGADLRDPDGWLRGGLDPGMSTIRLREVAGKLVKEFLRRAGKNG